MSSQQQSDVVYTISKIAYLYTDPEIDILSPNVSELRGESAFRRFLHEHEDELKDKSKLPRLIIKLPADQISPGLEERVRDGVQRFAAQTIHDNVLVLRDMRNKGRRQSVSGLLFLGLCLLIALGFSFVQGSPVVHSIAQILVQGFTVIGWVGLWHPVEILLFDQSPYIQANNILSNLESLDIKILPQS